MAYHIQNFIADCGGLFGLFLGISFVSVVNLIVDFLSKIQQKQDEKSCGNKTQEINVNFIEVEPNENVAVY